MADETRDPPDLVEDEERLETIRWYLEQWMDLAEEDGLPDRADAQLVLARLDAADPIRQLWPEVVEALEGSVDLLHRIIDEADDDMEWGEERNALHGFRALLARARALTPEEVFDRLQRERDEAREAVDYWAKLYRIYNHTQPDEGVPG